MRGRSSLCPSAAVLQIEILDSWENTSPKSRAHRFGLGRVDAHRHPDMAGFLVGRFVEHFRVTVKPAHDARMAQEQDAFDFGDVVEAITTKLIRRHPHVFGNQHARDPESVKGLWDAIKAQEKKDKAARGKPVHEGALAGVPVALPALTRALKLQSKASKVGFDWNDPRAVLRKIREEADEIEAALDRDDPSAAAEVGDLLFAAVNLARHLDADPEALLRQTNRKFERRFSSIEQALATRGKAPQDATLVEMDALWDEAKAQEVASKQT